MAQKTLAVKYRPSSFDDVAEQKSIKIILTQQLESGTIKNAYLFVGGAGTGKTTCARIFANEINKGKGNPIEMDAASNSSVDDVREIIQQAKTKSIDSEYKCFIIDECVTGDTEILTRKGWKRIDSITELDDVAQYTEDGRIEFVENWEYVKKEYFGDMYDVSFRNGKRHVLMSPHHVQPTRKVKSKELVEEYIQDAKFGQCRELVVAGKGTGNNELLSCFDRLYIACQADGYCNKNYSKSFWELHLSIPEKINRALDLLDDCGIEYKVYGEEGKGCSIRFYYEFPCSKKLCDYFDLNMGVDRAKDFIGEILLWDGSVKSGYPGYYSCTDKDNVDFVSAVLSLCGYSGTVNVSSDNNPNHNDVWSVNWYYQDYRTGQAVSKKIIHDWKGIIYCVKVPSQMIVLRADGFTFISGNCHSISNTGWQAFLKLLEEPPAKSIFIFCTTNPEKIPKTILSRVQRYDFQRISQNGIVDRLQFILESEGYRLRDKITEDAVEYIAKLADGGMRDAITMMDKCLAFSPELTLANVIETLGTVDYDTMFKLTNRLMDDKRSEIIELIESIHNAGKDLKQFMKSYSYFLLDILKFSAGCSFSLMQIPELDSYKQELESYGDWEYEFVNKLLKTVLEINSEIKYSSYIKGDVEARLILFCAEGSNK